MSKRAQKLLALSASIGAVAVAATAGALMPKAMVPWVIILGACVMWSAGFAIGRLFGSAQGWSLWALGAALAAAFGTTGLIPYRSLMFLGAALLVSVATLLSAKAVSDAIDGLHNQH